MEISIIHNNLICGKTLDAYETILQDLKSLSKYCNNLQNGKEYFNRQALMIEKNAISNQ